MTSKHPKLAPNLDGHEFSQFLNYTSHALGTSLIHHLMPRNNNLHKDDASIFRIIRGK